MNYLFRFWAVIGLIFAASIAYCQKDFNNTVVLSCTYFYFPKTYKPFTLQTPIPLLPIGNWSLADQFGVYYERRVFKNLEAGLGYVTWNNVRWLTKTTYDGSPTILNGPGPYENHHVLERVDYKLVDFYCLYEFNHFKRHKIYVGGGVTYTWGKDIVVDTVYVNPDPPYDGFVESHRQKGSYLGILGNLRYDYTLMANRLSIGADFKFRDYYGLVAYQIDYGFHVTCKF